MPCHSAVDQEFRRGPDRSCESFEVLDKRAPCQCELPSCFCSGIPGILAVVVDGKVTADAVVERCDLCSLYPSDAAALAKMTELGMVPPESQRSSFNVTCYAVVRRSFPGVVAKDAQSAASQVRDRFDWDVHGPGAEFVEESQLLVLVDQADSNPSPRLALKIEEDNA